MANSPSYVLDSSAVIAFLAAEPGAETVERALAHSVICAVNLGEVFTKMMRRSGSAEKAEALLLGLNLEVVAWTEQLVAHGLDLCPYAWTHGLSLADRACLTVAYATDRAALTSDAAWLDIAASFDPPIKVELFRAKKASSR